MIFKNGLPIVLQLECQNGILPLLGIVDIQLILRVELITNCKIVFSNKMIL